MGHDQALQGGAAQRRHFRPDLASAVPPRFQAVCGSSTTHSSALLHPALKSFREVKSALARNITSRKKATQELRAAGKRKHDSASAAVQSCEPEAADFQDFNLACGHLEHLIDENKQLQMKYKQRKTDQLAAVAARHAAEKRARAAEKRAAAAQQQMALLTGQLADSRRELGAALQAADKLRKAALASRTVQNLNESMREMIKANGVPPMTTPGPTQRPPAKDGGEPSAFGEPVETADSEERQHPRPPFGVLQLY